MQVPDHISVTGQALRIDRNFEPHVMEQERAVKLMNVPDRIVLTGGNGYKGFASHPSDFMDERSPSVNENYLLDLPSSLTLAECPVLENGYERLENDESARCESSMAIDENPMRELKIMRRQLGGLSSRLYQLEDELGRHRSKEKLFMTTIFGIAAAMLLALFKR